MKQLLLDLPAAKPQTLATFVAGRNEELWQLLQRCATRATRDQAERFVYLWGGAGAGKSHLLNALATTPATRLIPASAPLADFEYAPEVSLYLLDDCNALPPESQVAAFNLYNQAREHGAALVAAGNAAPAGLALREDLRTRLGWSLVFQLHELSDAEKITALEAAARARGLMVSAGVFPYLITHFRRDMRSLSAMLDALDQYSLETKRPITLPLLNSLLQLDLNV